MSPPYVVTESELERMVGCRLRGRGKPTGEYKPNPGEDVIRMMDYGNNSKRMTLIQHLPSEIVTI
ncbi:unnamed protein product [Fusarium graminearum]|nr:unnamed protein product [Fusarium graminearum]